MLKRQLLLLLSTTCVCLYPFLAVLQIITGYTIDQLIRCNQLLGLCGALLLKPRNPWSFSYRSRSAMEKSGYGKDGIFRSLRPPLRLPQDPNMSVVPFLFRKSHDYPGRLALTDAETGEKLSFSGFQDKVVLVGKGLYSLGIRKGDVVLLFSANSVYFLLCFFGILSIGGVATTVNPVYTAAEVKKQVKDSKPKMIITVPELSEKIKDLGLPVILIGAPGTQQIPVPLVLQFPDLVRKGESLELPKISIRQTDTAALLYSSGTTGANKGVVLTHRNLIAGALMISAEQELRGEPQLTYFILIPMFHAYGLVISLTQLQRGDSVVATGKFNFVNMLEAIQKYRVTHLPIVPPIIIALAKEEIVKKYDLSSVKQVISGAAPLGKEVQEGCSKRLPQGNVIQGYGLTECAAIGTIDVTFDRCGRIGSVGQLVSGVEAKIIDVETGKSLPPNQNGEICLRGPNVMKGYYNNPQATKITLDREGWLHTGDLGHFDEDGYLYIVDRMKELIKYKGLQVAPAELEALLLTHPQLLDAAVIPKPDESAGEVPVGYVVRAPGSSVTEQELLEFVAKQVAAFKRLHRITFVNAIPKSVSGKILRRQLIDMLKSKL